MFIGSVLLSRNLKYTCAREYILTWLNNKVHQKTDAKSLVDDITYQKPRVTCVGMVFIVNAPKV